MNSKGRPDLRPIYRWKSFWFGVIVFTSIGWGWQASMQRFFCAHWGSPAGRWIVRIENQSGYFRLQAGQLPVEVKASSGFQIQNSIPPVSLPTWFPEQDPILLYRPFGAYMIQVSHWLLMAVVLTGWGSLLARWNTSGKSKGEEPEAGT